MPASPANPGVTEQSTAKFQPDPARKGVAVCLSGGGYRAALFHCGAMRRLDELGVLGNVDVFSAVSGGSIFAAHLARNWSIARGGRFANYETQIAAPFRAFVKHDIRTSSALRRLLPWKWFDGGAQAEGLQAKYDQLLTNGMRLKDLPPWPEFIFCATDLTFGVNWIFTRDKVGDYQAGYMDPARAAEVPVAQAVAASSCFPPVFKPMPLDLRPTDLPIRGKCPLGPERDACIRSIALTDGGVYDNMGTEPVWKRCQTLFVSDGGKPFRFTRKTAFVRQVLRITDVMGNQAQALRTRWIVTSYLDGKYGGAYWGIDNATTDYPHSAVPGYSEALADEVLAAIRTDMDCFSDGEAAVLENHGYALAEAAVKTYVPEMYKVVPFTPPCPQLATATEADLRTMLAESDDFKMFGH